MFVYVHHVVFFQLSKYLDFEETRNIRNIRIYKKI